MTRTSGHRPHDVVHLTARRSLPQVQPHAPQKKPRPAPPSDAGEKAAEALKVPAAPLELYADPAFLALAQPVVAAFRANLKMAPAQAAAAKSLLGSASFLALSAEEQAAALSPPRPDRLAHTLSLVEHPLWSVLTGSKLGLFAASARTQDAVLKQLEAFPTMAVGQDLMALSRARWFAKLKPEDQVRAVKIFAFSASQLVGASFEDQGVSQRKLIENTLKAVLEDPKLSLSFEDLPYGPHETVAGESVRPGKVILNRKAIAADDLPIGGGPDGLLEEHFALSTLVHEVNHLRNEAPAPGTALAFQDEYRAWFAGFVALMSRFPNRIEGLARVRDLLTQPAYADLREAVDHKPEEAKQILSFLQRFGAIHSAKDVENLSITDVVSRAPLPAPLGNMNNT
ncbi:MAG: hypothetical protein U1E65_19820 [Myxococcota bacterium]